MTIAEKVSIAIGVISLIGVIPVLQVWCEWLARLLPARLLIGFKTREPLDVILTTSALELSPIGASVIRATTGIGQVEGVAYLSRFLGAAYRKKVTSIAISKQASTRLNEDLVLFGGPSKNEYSSRFIEKLSTEVPGLRLVVDDNGSKLEVAGNLYDIQNLRIHKGLPGKDIALVVVWKNPFSANAKRAVYCAGMTSYGTSGAAAWLFQDVLMSGARRGKLVKKVGRWSPSFLAVLEVEIVNGSVASVSDLFVTGIPPKQA